MKLTVETKISELVKLGHERAAELKGSFEAINACSVAQLISDLATQLEVQFARSNALAAKLSMINGLMDAAEQANKLAQEATEKLVQERDALAAENAGLIRSSEILLHEASEVYRAYNKTQLPDGDLVDEQSLQEVYDAINATPATDTFLAEVRAGAIPEGYVLVPQEMHLSSEAMEGICFHCGDGGFAFGEFTDGLLFVGAIDDSDGQKIHGLHIATADYPEEGCATICEFLPAPTQGAAQLRKGGAA